MPEVSAVVPVFNEVENLPELSRRLADVLNVSTRGDWEIVYVDDGSRDASATIIADLHASDPRHKLLALSRNFGHQPAISAGLAHASGGAVVVIDADLQDPPEVVATLIERWRSGARVVPAVRSRRADGGVRGIGFKLFYPLLRRVADLPGGVIEAGVFGLMDRRVVDVFNRLPERNRFIPGLRGWLGFEVSPVEYERDARAAGEPKQSLRRLVNYALDGMLSFSYRPLRLVTLLGLIVSGFTFVGAVAYVLYVLIAKPANVGTGFFTTIVAVLFLGGVQLVSVGVVGEYVGRIYEEVKRRPLYVVRETLGIEPRSSRDSE